MTTPSLLSLFPTPQNLLALTPEDLSGSIIEVVPQFILNGQFNNLSLYKSHAISHPPDTRLPVMLAFAEARHAPDRPVGAMPTRSIQSHRIVEGSSSQRHNISN